MDNWILVVGGFHESDKWAQSNTDCGVFNNLVIDGCELWHSFNLHSHLICKRLLYCLFLDSFWWPFIRRIPAKKASLTKMLMNTWVYFHFCIHCLFKFLNRYFIMKNKLFTWHAKWIIYNFFFLIIHDCRNNHGFFFFWGGGEFLFSKLSHQLILPAHQIGFLFTIKFLAPISATHGFNNLFRKFILPVKRGKGYSFDKLSTANTQSLLLHFFL